ncbi:hypothetical protein IPA_05065 [Ignicoccus pacificus DSM 13166]|uniref:Exosome complex component Csl4 n=1 Tax=Ignicoccus pacificus DSM 13166 TaxID=940294 RepID=A0A977K9J1_9CREN|nr:hypothetical protein IPA_05065 [Ignicoccus pacificus DSM 13166]
MPFVRNGERVIPGQKLCVIEELTPGKGTYEDENGIVRAAIPGVVRLDLMNYVVEVKGKSADQELPSGKDIVIGYVLGMRDEVAAIKIVKSVHGVLKGMVFTGALHISQASPRGYLNTLYDGYRPGDIVKLKVLSGPPYVLSAKGNRLGVILAHCSNCGAPLYLRKDGNLKCKRCGNTEKRVTSVDYVLRER